MLSFINLHEMAGRATPNKIMSYKLALQLYRTFNDQTPTQDWLNIKENIILGSRQTKFSINKSCRLKVGMNASSNRFNYLNNKIDLNWLNLASRSSANPCSYHKPSTKLINGQINFLQSKKRANEWLKLLWQNNFIISILQTDNNYIWW